MSVIRILMKGTYVAQAIIKLAMVGKGDEALGIWCTLHTFWRHHIRYDVTTYFLTSRRTSWRHDVLFDIMTYFLHFFAAMTYFMTLWHTLWCHNLPYFRRHDILLSSWRTLRTFCTICLHDMPWCHTLWRHDIIYVLFMLWRIFRCHGVPLI